MGLGEVTEEPGKDLKRTNNQRIVLYASHLRALAEEWSQISKVNTLAKGCISRCSGHVHSELAGPKRRRSAPHRSFDEL